MLDTLPQNSWNTVIHLLGSAGALIFYSRFYVQWIVSERRGQSTIPVAFWYMSAVGALVLFSYSCLIQSPVGTLSYCFNIVIYARNLIHIGRERGRLSPTRSNVIHGAAGGVVLLGMALTAHTWLLEYHGGRNTPQQEQLTTWFWVAVGTLGTGLFALRFLVQWVVTEIKKKSTVPVSFWYISLVAAACLGSAYTARAEWVLAIGVATTAPIYARNLWMIHRKKPSDD